MKARARVILLCILPATVVNGDEKENKPRCASEVGRPVRIVLRRLWIMYAVRETRRLLSLVTSQRSLRWDLGFPLLSPGFS